jgi:hypothetical protein
MGFDHQNLSAKSRNSRVSDTQVFGYSAAGIPLYQSDASELTLVLREFGFAPKFHTFGNRDLAAFIGSSSDTFTLVLC